MELQYRMITYDLPRQLLSILDAVLTVSPNRQYRGSLVPTIPAVHGPISTPTHSITQWTILYRSVMYGNFSFKKNFFEEKKFSLQKSILTDINLIGCQIAVLTLELRYIGHG